MGDAVRQLLFVLTTILGSTSSILGQPATNAPLQLEAKVPLGAVSGRIDHMAVDLERRRLFVAELGTNDLLYVANGGDGSLRLLLPQAGSSSSILPVT